MLGAAGTTAASVLAGCEHGTTPGAPDASISLKDVRLVQTVEESRLTSGSATLPDPPLVADEYTTVLFDLDVTRPENLPTTMPVIVSSTPDYTDPNFPLTMVLHKDDAQAIAGGADAAAVFHARTDKSGRGSPPPVFRIPEGVSEMTVKIPDAGVSGDSVKLTEGSSGNFQIGTLDTLRVGFIPVMDPGGTVRPGAWHTHDRYGLPHWHSTDIDWGDSDGRSKYYDRSVASSFAYLRRAYPSKVVAYKHGTHMVGNLREITDQTATLDAEEAMVTLNRISARSSFPANGTVLTEDVPRSDAVRMMDASQGGGFDAHVLVCPQEGDTNHQKYFPAHWGSDPPAGYHYHPNAAVASHEAQAGTVDDVGHAHITAQEVGHRFAQPLYSGPFKKAGNDPTHADGGLESVGYDLTDGSYTLVNDFSVDDGAFDPGPVQTGRNGPAVETHQSYMSYGGRDVWADSRVHQYLVEGDYATLYGGGSAPAVGAAGAAGLLEGGRRPREVQPVVDLFATAGEGGVDLDGAATYPAVPGGNGYDSGRHTGAEPVDVVLLGPDGEELHRTTVPDRVEGSHGETHPAVAVSLPFPQRGVGVRFDRGGESTRVNPIVAPLRFALLDVPIEPLAEGETTMKGLLEALRAVDAEMADQQYGAAASVLTEQFAPGVEEGVQPYEALANQPTPGQLLGLTDRMVERLEALAGTGGGDRTPTPEPTEVGVDPTKTYLRTASDDPAGDAPAHSLSELGVEPGSKVTLRRVGSYEKRGSGGQGLTAVFSATATLESSDQRHRVPGAIDAGPDYQTAPTYYGNQATNIPEDFLVSDAAGEDPSVTVDVPSEARYLFASVIDNLFQDNTDDDGDLALRVEG